MRNLLLTISIAWLCACATPARATFETQVLGDNPVGFWTLNDAGPIAADSSPGAFNGIFGPGVTAQGVAGPSWVPGPGLVADFNGGTTNFSSSLNLGGREYTIEAWVYPSALSLTRTTRVVASGDGYGGYGFGTASGARLVFTSFSRHDYFTSGLTLLPDQWQYIGVVIDTNSDANFYVNGTFIETVEGTLQTAAPTGNFTFGNQSTGEGHTEEIYTGGLAGVSVYNTALTGTQILNQYNASLVPEPSSLMLSSMAIGIGCVLIRRRRKS